MADHSFNGKLDVKHHIDLLSKPLHKLPNTDLNGIGYQTTKKFS